MARRTLGTDTFAGVAALIVVMASVFLAGGPARAGSLPTQVSPAQPGATSTGYPASTSAAPAATTTIAPLGNSLPVSPVTPALRTRGSNAHVSPVFAILSGIGFGVAILIMAGRFFVTRRGGPDRGPDPVGTTGDGAGGPRAAVGAGGQGPASRSS